MTGEYSIRGIAESEECPSRGACQGQVYWPSKGGDFMASTDERLGRELGWLSLGLGLPAVAAPRAFARTLGVSGDGDSRALARVVGLRELAVAAGLLAQPRRAEWLWARVVGDAMDLALLGGALVRGAPGRGRLLASTAAVVGITAVDVYGARRLSSERGQTKEGQAMDVRQAITINRPPDEIYQFWRDFTNLPRFMHHLEEVRVLDERRSHWEAKAPAGQAVEWDAEIIDDHPNEWIAWRSLPGADVENAGTVRFAPAPGGRGTEVRVELHYAPPAGPLGKAVAALFGEEPAQQVRDDLRALKQVLETGEVVHSDASIHGRPHPARPPERQPGRVGAARAGQ
jgi:uncharacterized membrane protein